MSDISVGSFTVGGGFETLVRRHRRLSAALESNDPDLVRHVQRALRAAPRDLSKYDVVSEGYDGNLIVNEGLNKLLDVWLSGGAATTSYYISLYKSNTTPAATWTLATYRSLVTEMEDYDESTREVWTEAGASSQSISNTASPADFTISASATIYGAALVSASSKTGAGDSAGWMVAATKYGTARAVLDNDVVTVRYTINAAST